MNKCKITQNLIDQSIDTDLKHHTEIQEHIDTCQACLTYLKTAQNIDQQLTQMTELDAPDQLVDSTLASILSMQDNTQDTDAIEALEKKQSSKTSSVLKPQWANALAASFMLVSLIALFPYNSISEYRLFSSSEQPTNQAPISKDSGQKKKKIKPNLEYLNPSNESHGVDLIKLETGDSYDAGYRSAQNAPVPYIVDEPFDSSPFSLKEEIMKVDDESLTLEKHTREHIAQAFERSNRQSMGAEFKSKKPEPSTYKSEVASSSLHRIIKPNDKTETEEIDAITVTDSNIRGVDIKEAEKRSDNNQSSFVNKNSVTKDDQFKDKSVMVTENNASQISDYDSSSAVPQRREQSPEQSETLILGNSTVQSDFPLGQQYPQKSTEPNTAQKYLAELQSLAKVTYQQATGYWQNTYVPGDSHMRLIHSQLLQGSTQGQLIHDAIKANIQPFDKPRDSAMAMYLSSDHASLENDKPQRMRLQVGLQASDKKNGHRSPLNIGIVLNLDESPGNPTEQIKKVEALLTSLAKSKQTTDNITLTLTGSNGRRLIDASDFRYGSVQVALKTMKDRTRSTNAQLSITNAIHDAYKDIFKYDDNKNNLGSSMILYISDTTLGNHYHSLKQYANQYALDGVTFSTISLTPENQTTLNKLAMVGQGHARIMQTIDDAKRIINEELFASSRAVARALRLSIKLAKGVKLINVINSKNLDDQQTQMVRKAEQSIDQKISQDLGIASDRGQDEQGIQIVIPAFYAGDTHVILLDVVAANAGPIADVSLRYKDLLYLNNATSHKQLNISNQPQPLGPLQYNVRKNLLAQHFSQQITNAVEALKKQDKDTAIELLMTLQDLYTSMQSEIPQWNNDHEILKDKNLLKKYIQLLQSVSLHDAQQVSFLIDSLQYISWRKSTSTPM